MTGGQEHSNGGKYFGIAVGLAAIIAVPFAMFGPINDWFDSDSDSNDPTPPSSRTTTPVTVTGTPVETTDSGMWGGDPPPTTTPSTPAHTAPPISTAVDQISIYIEPLQGRKVGPTTYAFTGNQDFGLGYGWNGTAGGVEVDGESCQILMQVTGAETFPAQRTAQCSRRVGSPFNGGINSERLTVPGEYTITVTDELTNTVGTATFTLLGR